MSGANALLGAITGGAGGINGGSSGTGSADSLRSDTGAIDFGTYYGGSGSGGSFSPWHVAAVAGVVLGVYLIVRR